MELRRNVKQVQIQADYAQVNDELHKYELENSFQEQIK